MPCFAPLAGWRSRERNASGKRGITFKFRDGFADMPVEVPCGQCIGCRIGRARAWAMRCMHEATLHERNCFLTLTYRENPGTLRLSDLQKFMKRLRKEVKEPLRYFAVGEYGERLGRPHYHLLLFGYDFEDKYYWCGSGLSRQYRSDLLERIWTLGNSTVGSVTSASAQYVSQYCVKVVTGQKASDHYKGRAPEFAVMSRRPGIGKGWIDQYEKAVFPRDFVVVPGGRKVPVPRYYLDLQDEAVKRQMKASRQARNEDNPDNRGWRVIARAHCAQERFNSKKRGYENG